MDTRFPRALLAAAVVLMTGCGGGGGGGGSSSGGGGGGGDGGSGWVAGQFAPAANFEARCENPRSGLDPYTNEPVADIQGTTLDENNWLRSWSNDTYLWYDEIVDRDPGLYSDPLDYFALLKTFARTESGAERDKFHFTYDSAEYAALSQSGVSVGYGVTWSVLAGIPPRDVAVTYAEPGTPAGDAGLAHGDRVLSVDGIDVVNDGTQFGTDLINAGLYPEMSGETHEFVFLDLETQTTFQVQMTSGEVTSSPVQLTRTVTSAAGATVGYLLFNDHIATSEQQLIDAIETLAAVPGGIDDLVVDIRYNLGGFIAISSQLAYMIAGADRTLGKIFEVSEFNDKHPTINPVTGNTIVPLPFLDETIGLSAPVTDPPTILPSLDLGRVFVLTGANTCSASEALVNGLRGIGVEVIQIGETTCGKPYGFYPADNCGTTYFSVQIRAINDAGFGDYTDGFTPAGFGAVSDTRPPGCQVGDDFEHRLGDPAEARLATALFYRDSGTCPASSFSLSTGGSSKTFANRSTEPLIFKPEPLRNLIFIP